MNILLVASEYKEKGVPSTGFPNYLNRISKTLTEWGHKVVIVHGASYDRHYFDDKVELFAVYRPHIVHEDKARQTLINSVMLSYLLNQKIESIVQSRKIDIIQFTSLEGTSLFYQGPVPAVLRLSSYSKTYFASNQTYSKSVVDTLEKLEREASRVCDGVFAPCKITAEAFSEDINRCVEVIETPFVNECKGEDNSIYDSKLKGKSYILFFGTLYAEKGILVIAETLKRILGEHPHMYFVAIGDNTSIDGKYADEILVEAAGDYADRVLIMNAMQHRFLYPIIKKANLVILPSLMDNFPNACIEAMYFSRIVVGTDGASFEQLIDDGNSGFLCKIGDSESLYTKVSEALSLSPEKVLIIQNNARQRIANLKPEISVNALLKYYEKTINSGRTQSSYSVCEEYTNIVKTFLPVNVEKRNILGSKSFLQYRLVSRWLRLRQSKRSIVDYFANMGMRSVVIYGMDELGKMLYDELLSGGISVELCIDMNPIRYEGALVVSPEQLMEAKSICESEMEIRLKKADVMVVTAFYYFDDIKRNMSIIFDKEILSIEDVVQEI